MQDEDRFPAPEEYHTYLVCKTFGKLPSEVDEQPYADINLLLICMTVEAEVMEARRNG